MSFIKALPHWVQWSGALFVLALFFRFAMRGYDYLAYALAFFAVLVVLHRFAGDGAWRVISVLVCMGLMYFCAVEIPIVKNSFPDKDCGRPYLVVLGCAVHGDTPSLALTHRAEGAYRYLNKYPDSTAVVSGGQGSGENISEAKCMYDLLTGWGIDPKRIIMEDKAASTSENLDFSFDIIRSRGDDPDGNVTLVSSSYHMYRAKCMARLKGVDAKGCIGSMGYPVYMLSCYIREAFGVTHLWVFGD